jgi:hypothetical protein
LNGEQKQKHHRKLFKLLDYSSNQMKKQPQNKEKVTSLHIKKFKEKTTFLALTNSKIKIFSKFEKQMMIY